MSLRSAVLVLLCASAARSSPALAQLVGDRLEANNCASVVRGSVQNSTVNVICGMSREKVAELVGLAASPSAGDRAALLVRLNAIVPANSRFPVEAVARFLEILREQPVEDAKLADRFAQIAEEHVRLLQEIRAFRVSDPAVQALREAAAAACRARPIMTSPGPNWRRRANWCEPNVRPWPEVLADQQREEAGLVREQAKVERARLRVGEAAQLYEQAARLLPADDRDARGADWGSAGLSWTEQGRDFGDNAALISAIAAYRAALEERTRARVPRDWGATQNNLGAALIALGERQSGTGLLEEAVATIRLALQELTRERVPLDWAMAQMNLGNALWRLGERESGTGRLEAAVAAYGLACRSGPASGHRSTGRWRR